MSDPITLEIPHKLGLAGARARVEGGVGKIVEMVPGATTVAALGQRVASRLTVGDAKVRAEIDLPIFLRLFADKIKAKLAKEAPKMLE
jgi:hypothetical protein